MTDSLVIKGWLSTKWCLFFKATEISSVWKCFFTRNHAETRSSGIYRYLKVRWGQTEKFINQHTVSEQRRHLDLEMQVCSSSVCACHYTLSSPHVYICSQTQAHYNWDLIIASSLPVTTVLSLILILEVAGPLNSTAVCYQAVSTLPSALY